MELAFKTRKFSRKEKRTKGCIVTVTQIDNLFPYVLFFYGFIVVLAVELPALKKLHTAQAEMFRSRLEPKLGLAWVCFWVGGLWSIQNLTF